MRALDAFMNGVDRLGRRRSIIVMLGAVVFLFVYAQAEFRLFTPDWTRDSYSYYFASVALARGLDPYSLPVLQQLGAGLPRMIFPYLYPPVLAQLWTPLTWLGPDGAHEVTMVLSTVLAAANAFILWRLFPRVRRSGFWLVGFLLLNAVCGPLVSSVRLGQINVLLGTLIFGALLLERDDRPWSAGFLLALAILIKILAVVFLLDLVARRRGKTLLAVLVGGGVLVCGSIAWQGTLPWSQFLEMTHRPLPFATPLSLRIMIAGLPWHPSHSSSQVLAVLVAAALAADLFPRLIRVWRRGGDPADTWSALLLFMLLVFPMTWHHHYYLALLPFGRLLLSMERPIAKTAAAGLTLAVFLRYPSPLHILKPLGAAVALFLPWWSARRPDLPMGSASGAGLEPRPGSREAPDATG